MRGYRMPIKCRSCLQYFDKIRGNTHSAPPPTGGREATPTQHHSPQEEGRAPCPSPPHVPSEAVLTPTSVFLRKQFLWLPSVTSCGAFLITVFFTWLCFRFTLAFHDVFFKADRKKNPKNMSTVFKLS